ncbi:hypothetical protein HNR03_003779 [Pseudomonas sp. JAI111]|jgi:hypothetical protein|uniref:DUF4810 domain-containing protein n=1 Tax=unclassified Pseudomonas TaxID=196821 RepID=UPI001C98E69E|nr:MULTISPECIES: DUF4810 domain-containing protein [unclassified Pseudomonas]MCS3839171.1 hypothetical protein [Pseudomonas sp. JAI111]QZP31190.1 DUF4810 domain-containing protein [Pseudomonas sp. DR48]
MFKMYAKWALMASTLLASGLLAGCSTPKTLYQWESYQPEVYEYFKGEQPKEAQAEALERDLQKIRSTGKTPPPGYHAHLGLLYLSMGKDDQMVQQFRTEKTLFPESTPYMDFLLKNAKAGVTQ